MPFCLSCRKYVVHKVDFDRQHGRRCRSDPAKYSCPKCMRIFKGKGGVTLHLKTCNIKAFDGTWTLPLSILKQQVEVINLLDTLKELKYDYQDNEPYYAFKNSESESNTVSDSKRVDYSRTQFEKREAMQKLLKIANEIKNELIKR